jgi:hypothetical protein
MTRKRMRTTKLRWVAVIVLVGAVVAGVTVTANAQNHHGEEQAAMVTVTPATHLIAKHRVTMWIGSVSLDRAVIQLTRPPNNAKEGERGTWEFITGAILQAGDRSVHATETQGRLADGTLTLTLKFNDPRAIGESVMGLDMNTGNYFLEVKWPNWPAV